MSVILINPSDTLIKPSLTLTPKNNFTKITFSGIPVIDTKTYAISFDMGVNYSNIATTIGLGSGTFARTYIPPLSTDKTHGTYVNYSILQNDETPYLFYTVYPDTSSSAISSQNWDVYGNSCPISSSNCSIGVSVSNYGEWGKTTTGLQTKVINGITYYYKYLMCTYTITLKMADMNSAKGFLNSRMTLTKSTLFKWIGRVSTNNNEMGTNSYTGDDITTARKVFGSNDVNETQSAVAVVDLDKYIVSFTFDLKYGVEAMNYYPLTSIDTKLGFIEVLQKMSGKITFTDITEEDDEKTPQIQSSSKTSGYTYTYDNNFLLSYNEMRNGYQYYMYLGSEFLSRYADTKHTATITIKVGDYYNADNKTEKLKGISMSADNKYIMVGDKVRPYIYNSDNELTPLLSKNGTAVDFVVMSSTIEFDGGYFKDELEIMEE